MRAKGPPAIPFFIQDLRPWEGGGAKGGYQAWRHGACLPERTFLSPNFHQRLWEPSLSLVTKLEIGMLPLSGLQSWNLELSVVVDGLPSGCWPFEEGRFSKVTLAFRRTAGRCGRGIYLAGAPKGITTRRLM